MFCLTREWFLRGHHQADVLFRIIAKDVPTLKNPIGLFSGQCDRLRLFHGEEGRRNERIASKEIEKGNEMKDASSKGE